MKRVNIQDAFIGEANPGMEGLDAAESDEAVVVQVRAGELTIVVPSGTGNDNLVHLAKVIRGELRLEHERVMTFEIQAGAIGAFYEDEPAYIHLQRSEQPAHGMMSLTTGASIHAAGRRSLARDIMATEVVTVKPDTSVSELSKVLAFHRISGAPVVSAEGKLVGVVSEGDLIVKQGATVGDIMTRQVISVSEDTPLDQVSAIIGKERVKRVLVVRDERVVGLISQGDLVRWIGGQR